MGKEKKDSGIDLINAKRELYRQLLLKSHDDYSETDLDLAYTLSKDTDIQRILRERLDKDKEVTDNGSNGTTQEPN